MFDSKRTQRPRSIENYFEVDGSNNDSEMRIAAIGVLKFEISKVYITLVN